MGTRAVSICTPPAGEHRQEAGGAGSRRVHPGGLVHSSHDGQGVLPEGQPFECLRSRARRVPARQVHRGLAGAAAVVWGLRGCGCAVCSSIYREHDGWDGLEQADNHVPEHVSSGAPVPAVASDQQHRRRDQRAGDGAGFVAVHGWATLRDQPDHVAGWRSPVQPEHAAPHFRHHERILSGHQCSQEVVQIALLQSVRPSSE
mmetsp:Transcript_3674/g.8609  ORF Transcript_3674/g.8609 Transcript_3674/m.8609 type:complete len:202 (+) Transcript_3674:793-1398(+)